MLLPDEKTDMSYNNPKLLILYGKPKCGKSTLISEIPDDFKYLVIDLQNGYEHLSARKVIVENFEDLTKIGKAIAEENKKVVEKGEGLYKYRVGVIDPVTNLDEIILPYAKKLYMSTPMGAKWKGTDVRSLPNGGGYLYYRNAIKRTIHGFSKLFETLILVGHTKDSVIDKDGESMTETSFDFVGKTGDIVAAEACAVGYVYRKGKKTIVDFKSNSNQIKAARCRHLREKEIVLAESNNSNHVKVDWSLLLMSDEDLNNFAKKEKEEIKNQNK